MLNTTFLAIELFASLVGGLVSGLLCMMLVRGRKGAEEAVKEFAGRVNLGFRSSFLLFAILVAVSHSLIVGAVRAAGALENVSLMASVPYLLPFTVLYSLLLFFAFWRSYGSGKEKDARRHWLVTSVIYAIVLNLVAGLFTFLLAMIIFFV